MLVAYGDTPLLEGEVLRAFAAEHEAAQRAVSILSGHRGRPVRLRPRGAQRRGRRRGDRRGEGRDRRSSASIHEINSGILAFDAEFLLEALPRLGNDNAKGEYYLTDTVQLAREAGLHVGAHPIDDVVQTEGVNDRAQLAELGREMNRRILHRWMHEGVTVMDPATTWVDADVTLAADVTLLPGVQLLGATSRRRGRGDRPRHHAQGLRDRRRSPRRTHPRRARRGGRRRHRRAVRLPAARHPARRGRQDRHLRRDQERRDRRRRQGAAPVLRRRRRDRRGHATSAPARSSPTTTGSRSTARSSGGTRAPVRTTPSWRRSRSATARAPRAAPSYAATYRPAPSPSAPVPQRNLEGWVLSKRAGTEQAQAAAEALEHGRGHGPATDTDSEVGPAGGVGRIVVGPDREAQEPRP